MSYGLFLLYWLFCTQMNPINKILIVAATAAEIAPTVDKYHGHVPKSDILITGVGMTATAFSLGRHLVNHPYSLIINAGIAGSFDHSIPLGTVVSVEKDIFAELGAEDGEDFLSISNLGFGENTFIPPVLPHTLLPLVAGLNKVTGITVNLVHGNDSTIEAIHHRFGAEVESMEGAAVFYVAGPMGIPAIQVRAISNYVERRNRANWQIGPAIGNLNDWLSASVERATGFLQPDNNREL